MVARALPGGGGSAARARASAACLAAWRAAQGAAPRSPSLRFEGPPLGSSRMIGLPGLASPVSAADFFVLTEVVVFFFAAFFAAEALMMGFFMMWSLRPRWLTKLGRSHAVRCTPDGGKAPLQRPQPRSAVERAQGLLGVAI